MGTEVLEEGNLKGFTDTRSQLRRTIDFVIAMNQVLWEVESLKDVLTPARAS